MMFSRNMTERFVNQVNLGPDPNTLAYLINQGVKVTETHITMQERKAGKSYLSALNAVNYMLRVFISIIVIQWFRSKEENN